MPSKSLPKKFYLFTYEFILLLSMSYLQIMSSDPDRRLYLLTKTKLVVEMNLMSSNINYGRNHVGNLLPTLYDLYNIIYKNI